MTLEKPYFNRDKSITKTYNLEEETIIRLNLSIFYDRSMWYKILDEVIWEFIQQTDNICGYFLLLSSDRGDHIKFILKVREKDSRALALKADKHLRLFLKKYPSVSTKKIALKQSAIIDFKNNSIHYGIFDNIFEENSSSIFEIYRQNLAKVLIQVFQCHKQETLDSLMEIMIEFFAIFCNATELDNNEAYAIFDSILEEEYIRYKNQNLSSIKQINEENFESNKDSISQYLRESIKKKNYLYEEEWQNSWSKTVKEYYKSLSSSIEQDNMKNSYKHMIHIIFYLFDSKDKISVLYLFSNALRNIN